MERLKLDTEKLMDLETSSSELSESEKKQQLIDSIEVPEYHGSNGRPPVIADPRVYRALVYSVLNGSYITTAAKRAGVSHKSVFDALDKGERADNEFYYKFWQDMQVAEAIAEEEMVNVVRSAANYDWKAAMHWLERRHPDRWQKRDMQTVRHEGTVQHEHQSKFANQILDDPEKRKNARSLIQDSVVDAEYEEVNE